MTQSEGDFAGLALAGSVKESVSALLSAAGKQATLAHIRQVVTQARILAARFGESPEADMKRAALAAWCHDMAAVVPREGLVPEAERWGVPLSECDRAIPALIHGPLAAEVARQRLNVTDEDVLNAIRYHSTLRAGASTLEKIVFVADKLALDPSAPRRDFLPALQAARLEGLDAMAFTYLDWVIRHEDELGWTLHDNLRAAHAELARARMSEVESRDA
ncbi:MAG: bis(5'-nucleosyl)-tetraphosphatase (symmetrical) YqeK [Anaerolineae bacterium]|nr:bis(5'-nucleosyl)-tetraphosphatase (symmetrical) YqeK [Anaerolineae bacterium]